MYSPKLWLNSKKRRYYKVLVYTDLLGDLVLVRYWGSMDTARGGMKTNIVDSEDEVVSLLSRIAKQREKKGYTLTQRD